MRKTFFWIILSALIMIGLPWLAVALVKGPDGMAAVFLLFFAADPVWSVVQGIFAGREIRKRWFLPPLCPMFFLTGVWLFFDPGETAFLLYAAVYLVLGLAAMLVSADTGRSRKTPPG